MSESNTISPDSYKIADYFLYQIQEELPGWLCGLYIYGSSVLEDFQPNQSDVDFIAVVRHRPTNREIKILRSIHEHLRTMFPNQLDGIYTDEASIGEYQLRFPSCRNGILSMRTNWSESNQVTWYQLRHKAVCISGVPCEELPLQIDIEDVLAYQRMNIHSYWQPWIEQHASWINPEGWMLLHPRKVVWGALGITRLLYTLHCRDIASKTQAGEWALEFMPPEYQPLLREALYHRCRRGGSEYTSPFTRRRDCLEYMCSVVAMYEEEDTQNRRL